MPRTPRLKSDTGIYHIMLRGVNKQIIFVSHDDRDFFLELLQRCQQTYEVELFAYCLMDNHLHLLVRDARSFLGKFMGRLGSSYAQYFNKKYNRVGHLFQNRYKSLPVESDEYFLTVFRYIHQNPEQAGFGRFSWTSYREYELSRSNVVNTDFARSLFESREQLLRYLHEQDHADYQVNPFRERMLDFEAMEVINQIVMEDDSLAGGKLDNLYLLPRNRQIVLLRSFKNTGLTARQIGRLTGMSRCTIDRA